MQTIYHELTYGARDGFVLQSHSTDKKKGVSRTTIVPMSNKIAELIRNFGAELGMGHCELEGRIVFDLGEVLSAAEEVELLRTLNENMPADKSYGVQLGGNRSLFGGNSKIVMEGGSYKKQMDELLRRS